MRTPACRHIIRKHPPPPPTTHTPTLLLFSFYNKTTKKENEQFLLLTTFRVLKEGEAVVAWNLHPGVCHRVCETRSVNVRTGTHMRTRVRERACVRAWCVCVRAWCAGVCGVCRSMH